MKKNLFLTAMALGALLFSSCSGGSSSDTIVLSEFKIVDGGGTEQLRIDTEGNLFAQSKKIGTLNAAGEFKDEDGKLIGAFKGDTLKTTGGNPLSVIDNNGAFVNEEGTHLSWDEEGNLKNSTTAMKLVPADTKAKKAASAFLVTYFTIAGTSAQPVP